jgi:NAD(P)-dependent dehydrogenase (short-subunit alcohol dehydrogenase family)
MSAQTSPSHCQNVLVTGCSSGIGLRAAEMLRDRHYNLITTVRKPQDKARLEQQGFTVVLLDLADNNSVDRAFDEVMRLFNGRLDGLFNNAAYGQPGAVEDLTRTALREQFETNVLGTQQLTNLAIAVMRQQGFGRIVYNSSVLGLVSLAYRGAYNASKYAIEGLADTLRLELHGTGISVSLIEPGPITSRFRANAFAKYQQHINKHGSAHQQIYQAMEQRLNKTGAAAPFTLPPDAVVTKCLHAFASPRPKVRYYVTVPTYLFATLKRLLPHRALDWVLRKVSDSEKRPGRR